MRRKGAGLFPGAVMFLLDLVGPESLLQHRWPTSMQMQNSGCYSGRPCPVNRGRGPRIRNRWRSAELRAAGDAFDLAADQTLDDRLQIGVEPVAQHRLHRLANERLDQQSLAR